MLSRVNEASVVPGVSARSGSITRSLAVLSSLTGTTFLDAYLVLHALHVAGRDPKFVTRLSPVPLFACCGTAAIAGLLFGVSCSLVRLDHDKLLLRMPSILAVSVALFSLEILIWP